ncbi:hypothetical protein CHS0354_016667 [Potamilus streckersoni]|uniref:Uncharacterized protein n=1 Tax=Potamilus streckersoni TaxID=2493646 RepID=A0AAE0THF8_9BIVA|nr:hypothetical protein CHS0354_016667 [Potamilus streckersoni]
MATGGRYPGPHQGKATSGTALWYQIPILQVGLTRRRLEPEINDLLEAAYQQREWKVSFTDKDTGSYFTAYLRTKRLCYGNTTYALLERVYEELQPERKRVDIAQSPQIFNTNKPNDAKEKQTMAEQYKCKFSQLAAWLQKVTNGILQREFPTNLKDLKEELAEIGGIQTNDIPKWNETRKEMFRIFQDLQNNFAQPMYIDESQGPGSIQDTWIKFNSELGNREARLTAEIARLESLEIQLKKFDEDTKHLDDRLDDIEHCIQNVKKYKDMDYSLQARKDPVALERELKVIDEEVRCLLTDVVTLQKGGYSNIHQLLRRLLHLKSKSAEIRTLMFSSFTLKSTQPSLAMMLTAQHRKSSNGAQIVETKHVQDCLQWISTKQAALEGACYESDINLIEKALFQHGQEHQSIQVYKNEVEMCTKEREKLCKEEQDRFNEWHSKVQEAYKKLLLIEPSHKGEEALHASHLRFPRALLQDDQYFQLEKHSRVSGVYETRYILHSGLDTSLQRLSWLQSLQDFVQKAVQTLNWLQNKIELICSCSEELEKPYGQIYQIVSLEMKDNEVCFISIQEHGHSLVHKTHPAKTIIEAYISEMLSKWSWLRELLSCLHQHIQGICEYNQFFQEAQSCEQWINQQTEHVNNCMSKLEKIPFEKLEEMKKEYQDLQNAFVEYEKRVALLAKTSHDIIPLQQLNRQVTSAVKVHCVCTYDKPNLFFYSEK